MGEWNNDSMDEWGNVRMEKESTHTYHCGRQDAVSTLLLRCHDSEQLHNLSSDVGVVHQLCAPGVEREGKAIAAS